MSAVQRNAFWSEREWPLNRKDWIFFGCAIEALGPLLCSEWSGEEFGRPKLGPPPKLVTTAPEPGPTLSGTGRGPEANWKAGRDSAGGANRAATAALLASLEARAEAENERLSELYRPLDERATKVSRAVVQAFLDEELAAGYMDNRTGDIVPVPPSWWAAEDCSARFDWGKIDRLNPVRAGGWKEPKDPSWLFVASAKLTTFIEARSASEDWRPEIHAPAKDWCKRAAVQTAARARLRRGGRTNPTNADVAREVAAMWVIDGRKPVKWESFRDYMSAP